MQEDNFWENLGTFQLQQIEFAGRQNLFTLKALHVVFSLQSRNQDSDHSKKHEPSEKISCLHEQRRSVLRIAVGRNPHALQFVQP